MSVMMESSRTSLSELEMVYAVVCAEFNGREECYMVNAIQGIGITVHRTIRLYF